jgi:hypothetical protein
MGDEDDPTDDDDDGEDDDSQTYRFTYIFSEKKNMIMKLHLIA